ncbi:MAG TPA: hypothetical protein VIM47_07725 [Dermatophilaceae bacterium]
MPTDYATIVAGSALLTSLTAATEDAWAAVVASATCNGLPWGSPSRELMIYDRCVRELMAGWTIARRLPLAAPDLAVALFG